MGIILTCYLTFLQVAVGGFFGLLISEQLGNVTRGFLRLSSGVLLMITLIAWAAQSAISTGVATRIGFSALGIGLALYWVLLFTKRDRLRTAIGILSFAGGLTALAAVLFDQGSWQLLGWSALVLASEALALGAAWDGMLLGHWYLVTPRLTAGFPPDPGPLARLLHPHLHPPWQFPPIAPALLGLAGRRLHLPRQCHNCRTHLQP
jgi:hypothetical protein